jgi:hypothetical protein
MGGVATPSEMRTAPLVLSQRIFVGLRNPWSLAGLSFASLKPKADGEEGDGEEGEVARRGRGNPGASRAGPGDRQHDADDRQDEQGEDDDEP